jgi:hypothetical protein
MRSLRFVLTFKLFLILCLVSTIALGQEKTITSQTRSGNTVYVSSKKIVELPEASEPCEPIVCEWWSKLRQAANELQRKEDGKSKKKFVLLFVEGVEKSYRIPVKDRPSMVLASQRPEISDLMKVKKVSGEIILSIELRADASIGEIKVIKGLNPTLDNRFIQSTRQTIFLPAIKDGVFVTEWKESKITISTQL